MHAHLSGGTYVRPGQFLNEKFGFIIPTTRTHTFSMSARRFSAVCVGQFRRRVGIGILQGWLRVKKGLELAYPLTHGGLIQI